METLKIILLITAFTSFVFSIFGGLLEARGKLLSKEAITIVANIKSQAFIDLGHLIANRAFSTGVCCVAFYLFCKWFNP